MGGPSVNTFLGCALFRDELSDSTHVHVQASRRKDGLLDMQSIATEGEIWEEDLVASLGTSPSCKTTENELPEYSLRRTGSSPTWWRVRMTSQAGRGGHEETLSLYLHGVQQLAGRRRCAVLQLRLCPGRARLPCPGRARLPCALLCWSQAEKHAAAVEMARARRTATAIVRRFDRNKVSAGPVPGVARRALGDVDSVL
eukprot:6212296-Pleurochrysis_carterae.AAC.1